MICEKVELADDYPLEVCYSCIKRAHLTNLDMWINYNYQDSADLASKTPA